MAHEILIVDDEPDIRAQIEGILEDEGFETRVAHNSDTALAAFRVLQCPHPQVRLLPSGLVALVVRDFPINRVQLAQLTEIGVGQSAEFSRFLQSHNETNQDSLLGRLLDRLDRSGRRRGLRRHRPTSKLRLPVRVVDVPPGDWSLV